MQSQKLLMIINFKSKVFLTGLGVFIGYHLSKKFFGEGNKGENKFLYMQFANIKKIEMDVIKSFKFIESSAKTDIKYGIKEFVDWYTKYYLK